MKSCIPCEQIDPRENLCEQCESVSAVEHLHDEDVYLCSDCYNHPERKSKTEAGR